VADPQQAKTVPAGGTSFARRKYFDFVFLPQGQPILAGLGVAWVSLLYRFLFPISNFDFPVCPGFPQENDLGRDDRERAVFLACWPDGDFNILAQSREEFHEAANGKATRAVSHQQRDLGLLHAEDFGDLHCGMN